MNNTNPIIIGIDHGYGNIKTAHCCFKTGVAAYDKDRVIINDDICATAKGYELLAEQKQNRKGGIV